MNQVDPRQLLLAVQADRSLSKEERDRVLQILNQPDFLTKLTAGAFGASITYLIAKFLHLSKTAQVLLAIAGFGIGKLLLDASSHHTDRFATYNNKMKVYEINQG